MTRIGLLGGTFDPVHYGHLLLAESAREQLELDEVYWVPAAVSPFKRDRQSARPEDRCRMLELAIADHPDFRLSTVEIERGGISYTVATLRALREQVPSADWFLLMGADALQGFPHWREPEQILQMATIAVVQRPGSPEVRWDLIRSIASTAQIRAAQAALIEMPLIGISSTEIRSRVSEGHSIRYRTPPDVERYIAEHRLYRPQTT